MILCIDVGNSHIFGGVFDGEELKLRFRHTSIVSTSDALGIFLKNVLRENDCDPASIRQIALCSVVPSLDYSLRGACRKYFALEPFILQAGVRTGLHIKTQQPQEVGADRIANAIAAVQLYPNQNLIVLDFGTATTFCAINVKKEYLGGAILPGVRLSVDALSQNTAKLPPVEIIKMDAALGRTTIDNIQAGIYYGAVGACRELITRMAREAFGADQPFLVLATGGFAALFEQEKIYNHWVPDLVLQGIRFGANLNVAG